MHQLIVKVDGWQQALPPVSVDKVGVYFRHALVEIKSRSNVSLSVLKIFMEFSVFSNYTAKILRSILRIFCLMSIFEKY